MEPLRDQLIAEMKAFFAGDERRIGHAMAVLAFADELRDAEGGDVRIVTAAAVLHDVGIPAAEAKHGSADGHWQEVEGPPIARPILQRLGLAEGEIDHVCRIIANHHSARDIDTPEFRILWDADWLVNLPDVCRGADRAALARRIESTFKTPSGRRKATELYLRKADGMNMFCYQCEQAKGGKGCDQVGVCGKDAPTAAAQDLLIYAAKDIARFAHRARQLGAKDRSIDRFVVDVLFSTVTNVNFDAARLQALLKQAAGVRQKAADLYTAAAKKAGKTPDALADGVKWYAQVNDAAALLGLAEAVRLTKRVGELGPDITGLQELVTYGLKGTAAYADHASVLGQEDDEVYGFFHEALDYLTHRPTSAEALLGMALRVGEVNLKVMGLLDAANTGAYGQPEPTKVRVTPLKGKCIVVSGHDLKDLDELLKQTQGKGINVYTHGEMLPCLAYPGLKKYKHLVGNYGGAWQNQAAEFDRFPGAILMTTNCIQKPRVSYQDRLFTSGLVAWPGVKHIADGNFAPVIEAALKAPGFEADEPEKTITVGFGHAAVMSVAGAVIDAVKAGKIRRFFLIGGCDGAKPGRNYYTELAQQVPKDCVILTLACGKYRFNKLDFGDIGGIPRLLDIGQCNDSYSAVQIAVALANAFKCGVNDLPLSMVLSWYEQKAVCILLSLLHLGVKNIRIGPSLPAFVSPAALDVLVKKFNLMPITTPQDDLKAMLA